MNKFTIGPFTVTAPITSSEDPDLFAQVDIRLKDVGHGCGFTRSCFQLERDGACPSGTFARLLFTETRGLLLSTRNPAAPWKEKLTDAEERKLRQQTSQVSKRLFAIFKTAKQ